MSTPLFLCQKQVPSQQPLLRNGSKFVDKVRNHVQHLRQTILLFNIYQLGGSVLYHKYCTGGQLSAQSTASVILLLLGKSSRSYSKRHIHQWKNDRISYVDGIPYYCLADT